MPPASRLRVVLSVWKDLPKYWVTLLRSSFIGCWLGITPGGAIAASFMGYNLAKRFSKDPDSFGKGRIEGVFAPETAAHASGTAALLPMLALGIPGSGTAAILLGGLMVWGLNPGPLLFVEHKDFVWGLIASMYLGNVVGLVLVLTTVPIFASILRVPFAAVAPMIVVSCAIGAYAIQNAMFDIWLMLGFGVVGYVFKKIGIPLAPFTLALVLGNRAEDAFRLSMIGSGGDMRVFWSNWPGRLDHDAGDRAAVLAGDRQGDHVGNDPDIGCRRAAIFRQPQVEQTVVERSDGCRLLIHRRIGNHDVIARDSARREEFDIMCRRVGGIADRQCHDADIARYQHACGAFHRRVGAGALKRVAVKVVYVCRTIQADGDRDIARSKQSSHSSSISTPFVVTAIGISQPVRDEMLSQASAKR